MPRYLTMIRIDERNVPADGPSPELQERMGALFKEITERFLRTHEDSWTITAEVREIAEM